MVEFLPRALCGSVGWILFVSPSVQGEGLNFPILKGV